MTQNGVVETTQGMVLMYDHDETPKAARVAIDIPRECPACGFRNFYVWGTRISGRIKIVVKCMRCGK